MVTFEKEKLVIEMATKFPEEDWLNIVHELIGLLQSENGLLQKGEAPDACRFYVLELLREMMPTEEQTVKLTEKGSGDN